MTTISAWLIAKAGWFAKPLIEIAVAIALVCAFAYSFYSIGWNKRDAQASQQELQHRIAVLQSLVTFQSHQAVAVGDYILRRGGSETVYRTIRQEVPRVVTVYRTALDAPVQPLPACVFTRGFVRLYNQSLKESAGRADDRSDSAAAAEPADPAADDLLASGLDQQALLTNIVDNLALKAGDRQQCDALSAVAKTLPKSCTP